MSGQIIGLSPGLSPSLNPWLEQVPLRGGRAGVGAFSKDWASLQFDKAVPNIFGYHALQLGASCLETLAQSRIASRWIAADDGTDTRATLFANASALPFFESTLDLVTLPFTLDMHSDPDAVLDEVARVLVPEGRTIFVGFNVLSVWGATHLLGGKRLPEGVRIYGERRLKTSLEELGFVVDSVQNKNQRWDGLYFLIARKRVMAVRPMHRKAWRLPSWSELPLNPFPSPKPQAKSKAARDEDANE